MGKVIVVKKHKKEQAKKPVKVVGKKHHPKTDDAPDLKEAPTAPPSESAPTTEESKPAEKPVAKKPEKKKYPKGLSLEMLYDMLKHHSHIASNCVSFHEHDADGNEVDVEVE